MSGRPSQTLLALALLGGAGCESSAPAASPPAAAAPASTAAVEELGPTLWLAEAAAPAGTVGIDLHHGRHTGQAEPRMMELRLAYQGPLAYQSAAALAATEAAGKELVVQDQGGSLRVLIFASNNLETLGNGPLARFSFARTGAGPAAVRLVAERPIFAPPAADEGVLLGPELGLGGAP